MEPTIMRTHYLSFMRGNPCVWWIAFLLLALPARGQESDIDLAIGFRTRFAKAADKWHDYKSRRVGGHYTASRKDFALDLSYLIAPRIGMVSSAGISRYHAGAELYGGSALPSEAALSSTDLLLAQKLYWKLLFPRRGHAWNLDLGWILGMEEGVIFVPFQWAIYPYAGITYYQPLGRPRVEGSFSRLDGQGARDRVERHKLPAIASPGRRHTGTLVFTPGAHIEMIFGGKVGISYDLTYEVTLAGRSGIELEFLYEGPVGRAVYRDRRAYLAHTAGLTFHF